MPDHAAAPLDALPVAELRRIARTLHLPCTLTRNGRRADLLPALAGAADLSRP